MVGCLKIFLFTQHLLTVKKIFFSNNIDICRVESGSSFHISTPTTTKEPEKILIGCSSNSPADNICFIHSSLGLKEPPLNLTDSEILEFELNIVTR